jgi:putative iron-regulated protein
VTQFYPWIFLAGACLSSLNAHAATPPSAARALTENYANLAHAGFADALTQAKSLQEKVVSLTQSPSLASLQTARDAWKAARVPYMQTEVFRFSNPPVDEWEGQVNAWPLDEGLIDYVVPGYQHEMGNVAATANIIANTSLKIGNTTLALDPITPELLADLNELGGSEVNVATGYHAIEFLLWGQDRNGSGPGAGDRPFTDYAKGKDCTHGQCERRAQYLLSATELLVRDLTAMVALWQPGTKDNYRAQLLRQPETTLNKMLFGMGSLALGELAGERMKVALEANSTEDEHDCFSDNTHNSHYYNAKGIENLFFGRYQRIDGTAVSGASISELIKSKDPALHQKAVLAFGATESAFKRMVETAEDAKAPMKFDQMIAEGNAAGAAIIKNAINALVAETAVIEEVAKALGINHLNPDSSDHTF